MHKNAAIYFPIKGKLTKSAQGLLPGLGNIIEHGAQAAQTASHAAGGPGVLSRIGSALNPFGTAGRRSLSLGLGAGSLGGFAGGNNVGYNKGYDQGSSFGSQMGAGLGYQAARGQAENTGIMGRLMGNYGYQDNDINSILQAIGQHPQAMQAGKQGIFRRQLPW